MIVVASNDNESSQVTLPGFSICVPVPVIRGLTRFLTMVEVAEVEDSVVIIDCVAIFMKRAKKANIIATRISLNVGFRELKNTLVSLPLVAGAACEAVEIVDPERLTC